MPNLINWLDISTFVWLNSWVGFSDFIDWTIKFRATHLLYVVVFAIMVFLVASFFPRFREYKRKNLEFFTLAFSSAILARFVFTELIRFFYERPRPFEVLGAVKQLVEHPAGGSFPSGHAALSFAVATAVSFYYPKISILFFIAALNIGLARVAAGVHWPSDILGGVLVGIGAAWLTRWAYGELKKRLA